MVPGDAPILIDLGEDWSAAREPERTPRRRRSRRMPAAAAALALLLVLGGAEYVQPRLRLLAAFDATEAADVAFGPDTAFISDYSFATTPERDLYGVVSAYPLPGGAPRWQARLPQVPQRLQYLADAGVVVASVAYGPDDLLLTTALDAATGRQLWSTDEGWVADAPGDGLGLLSPDHGGMIQWVDLRTGRKIWSHPVPPDAQIQVAGRSTPADPDLVVLMTPDGTVDVFEERTGALVTSGNVGLIDPKDGQLGLPADPSAPSIDVLGNLMLVFRRHLAGPVTVTAYDLSHVSPLWTKSGALRGYATPCGPLICLPGDSGVSGVDPGTGDEVWRTAQWTDTGALDAGRLLAFADRPGDQLAILDTGTGRVRTPLGRWAIIPGAPGAPPALFARSSAADGGLALFAAADPGADAPTVLGALAGTAFETCWADAGLLGCRTGAQTIRIWRYGS